MKRIVSSHSYVMYIDQILSQEGEWISEMCLHNSRVIDTHTAGAPKYGGTNCNQVLLDLVGNLLRCFWCHYNPLYLNHEKNYKTFTFISKRSLFPNLAHSVVKSYRNVIEIWVKYKILKLVFGYLRAVWIEWSKTLIMTSSFAVCLYILHNFATARLFLRGHWRLMKNLSEGWQAYLNVIPDSFGSVLTPLFPASWFSRAFEAAFTPGTV